MPGVDTAPAILGVGGSKMGADMEIENTYKTSRGVIVEFLSIAALINKFRASHTLPEVPTYEITSATGIVEKHPLDAKSLEEHPEQFTDEHRAAWAQYQSDLVKAEAEYNAGMMRLMLMRGVKVEYPSNDDWVKQQTYLGITVPTDPMERRLHYLETEVLGSQEDYIRVSLGVMAASEATPDLLKQIEDTFRGRIQRDEVSRPDSQGGQVAGDGTVRAGEDSIQPTPDDKPVGRAKSRR